MKRIYVLALAFCGCLFNSLLAQVPEVFNYQAVIRDTSGEALQFAFVDVEVSLLKDNNPIPFYSEKHSDSTDAFGLMELKIGNGYDSWGTFDSLYSDGHFYLHMKINNVDMGTTELTSVPFAIKSTVSSYSQQADRAYNADRANLADRATLSDRATLADRATRADRATLADRATIADAVSAKTQTLAIPATAFTPNGDAGYKSSIGMGGATITSLAPGIVNVLNAPVFLPHGAKITSMVVYFKDESSVDFSASLSKEYFTNSFTTISSVTTSGSSSSFRSTTNAVSHTVNNSDGGYFIRVHCSNWTAAGDKLIKGVKIIYTY